MSPTRSQTKRWNFIMEQRERCYMRRCSPASIDSRCVPLNELVSKIVMQESCRLVLKRLGWQSKKITERGTVRMVERKSQLSEYLLLMPTLSLHSSNCSGCYNLHHSCFRNIILASKNFPVELRQVPLADIVGIQCEGKID